VTDSKSRLRSTVLAGIVLTLVLALRPQIAAGQLRGYYLNVASASDGGPVGEAGSGGDPFRDAGVADFQRLRIMIAPAFGPLTLDLSYEQTLEAHSSLGGGVPSSLGTARSAGDWLDLQGTVATSDRVAWLHRIDRASATLDLGESTEVTIGRQPISWATTLLLTPGDPFVPFTVEDPFREYRAGIDAARVRLFLGPFSDLDLVLRPAKSFDGEVTMTALGRLRTVVSGIELGGWLGALHDEAAGSAFLTATLGGAAARSEVVVREVDGKARVRVAAGLDRSFLVGGRDLYAILEFQHDQLGAASSTDIVRVLGTAAARRGELLTLGRDTGALQLEYSIHPLWSVDALVLANLIDPSLLLGPAASYSPSAESSLRLGLFVGLGRGPRMDGLPGSEYGSVPVIAYASLSAFF